MGQLAGRAHASKGEGDTLDLEEPEKQKLIDAGCYRLPNGKGIQRPDGHTGY
jgi:hypothetical protein